MTALNQTVFDLLYIDYVVTIVEAVYLKTDLYIVLLDIVPY
jgi:hypothetical protein